jgi:hypothetical protein
MMINPDITIDCDTSQVHDLRHIEPALDQGARLITYQIHDAATYMMTWGLLALSMAAAITLISAFIQNERRIYQRNRHIKSKSTMEGHRARSRYYHYRIHQPC